MADRRRLKKIIKKRFKSMLRSDIGSAQKYILIIVLKYNSIVYKEHKTLGTIAMKCIPGNKLMLRTKKLHDKELLVFGDGSILLV